MPRADSCPIIESGDWRAWIDVMPKVGRETPTLHVRGSMALPTPGYAIRFRMGPADRRNPPGLTLDLVLTPPDGVAPQVVTREDAAFSTPAPYRALRVLRIRCSGAVIAEIEPVETVG